MSIIVKGSESGPRELPGVGNHQAVCYTVLDIGLQNNPFNPERPLHKVIVFWELDDRMEDGRRFAASKSYTLSLFEKANLRQDLESWLGRELTDEELDKGFDVESLVGMNCTLNMVHKKSKDGKRTFANVAAVTPKMKSMEDMQPENTEPPEWAKQKVEGYEPDFP